MLLAEAVLAAENGQRVSYSRRKVFYSRAQRYRPRAFTYSVVMAVVDELVAHGLLHEHRVEPGRRGWQSSVWATPASLDVLGAHSEEMTYHPGERIRLKDATGELTRLVLIRQGFLQGRQRVPRQDVTAERIVSPQQALARFCPALGIEMGPI